jgi:two-component system C4-dicarboxylate transport sensor histidine kinase DctB
VRKSAHIPFRHTESAPAQSKHVSSPIDIDCGGLRRVGAFLLAAMFVLMSALLAQEWFTNAALAKLRQSSSFAIAGNAAALQTKLQKFRLVPVALSTDPELRDALEAPSEALQNSLNQRFEEIADASGAAAVYLINNAGVAFAASNYRTDRSFVGQNYSFREYFQQALEHRDAEEFAVGTVSGEPGLYISRSISSAAGVPLGVIVVKLQFDDIEAYWRNQNRLIFAADKFGRIMVTSREPLRFQDIGVLEGGVLDTPPSVLSAYLNDGPSLATVHPIPEGGWTVSSFEPLRPALATARVSGLMTGASLSALALGALALALYRLARNARRAEEVAAYRAQLETEVADRTRELQNSYARLTGETAKRESAQAELRVMHDEITQLNRLAILGQLSAKFAHEINQPLTAMRNYVENSLKLLSRGDYALVANNLETMSALMARARRISDELREFSRRRPSVATDVPVGQAIDGALLIASHALKAAAILMTRHQDADIEVVRVDRMRLEQVVLNIVQNAIDALKEQACARLEISSVIDSDWVLVRIADNGPGVSNVDDLFVPFRSGKAQGLGLGLSISTEILSDYGGELTFRPGKEGGAEFVIRLPRVNR